MTSCGGGRGALSRRTARAGAMFSLASGLVKRIVAGAPPPVLRCCGKKKNKRKEKRKGKKKKKESDELFCPESIAKRASVQLTSTLTPSSDTRGLSSPGAREGTAGSRRVHNHHRHRRVGNGDERPVLQAQGNLSASAGSVVRLGVTMARHGQTSRQSGAATERKRIGDAGNAAAADAGFAVGPKAQLDAVAAACQMLWRARLLEPGCGRGSARDRSCWTGAVKRKRERKRSRSMSFYTRQVSGAGRAALPVSGRSAPCMSQVSLFCGQDRSR
ncbi:hypothetical protein BDZ88DRAFT_424216 [Geranomyces variabilis]|nr:hypothetical protein BDZ88DRAFT_424216 [Geranomyces variabilis]